MATIPETPLPPGSTIKRLTRYTKRLRRDLFDSIVQITVGPEKEIFRIHKGLLCHASPFFKGALEGRFVEATNQAIELLEEDVTMFKYLQLWLYSDSIFEAEETLDAIKWETLLDIYVFAESHLIPDLQNTAMDLIMDKFVACWTLPTQHLKAIYERTLESSPIRRYMANLMAHYCSLSKDATFWTKTSRDYYSQEFLIDLAQAQFQEKVVLCTALNRHVIKVYQEKYQDYHVQPR